MTKKKDKRIKILYWITKDNKIIKYSPYAFPIDLFALLPNTKLNFFTSKTATPNTYLAAMTQRNVGLVSAYLKNLLWVGNYHLIERTAWQRVYSDAYSEYTDLLLFSKWNASIKLLLLTNSETSVLETVSTVYSNATWLERELSELFDLNITNLKDTRKLLLEYTSPRGFLNKKLNVQKQHRYNLNIKTNLVFFN